MRLESHLLWEDRRDLAIQRVVEDITSLGTVLGTLDFSKCRTWKRRIVERAAIGESPNRVYSVAENTIKMKAQ